MRTGLQGRVFVERLTALVIEAHMPVSVPKTPLTKGFQVRTEGTTNGDAFLNPVVHHVKSTGIIDTGNFFPLLEISKTQHRAVLGITNPKSR